MGYLLKEALKTLCGVNQWAYAVFWKVGCQNPKLLIWEECYYELVVPFGTENLSGSSWDLAEAHSSQHRTKAVNKVEELVNRMMIDKHINIVGEGLVGRAAFTGNHQWILSKNFSREAHPPEVLKELHQQVSAGMQTIAVIPVLPHGVIELGSYSTLMENIGFINDVKTLIHQLGCVPDVLLSDPSTTKELDVKIGIPVCRVNSALRDFCRIPNLTNSISFDNHIYAKNTGLGVGLENRAISSLIEQCQARLPTTATSYHAFNKTSSNENSNEGYCQVNNFSVPKQNFLRSGLESDVAKAEVIPGNSEVWLNQQSLYIPKSRFNEDLDVSSTGNSGNSISMKKLTTPDNGMQGNISDSKELSELEMSELITNAGLISCYPESSKTICLPEVSKICKGVDSHLKSLSEPDFLSDVNSSNYKNTSGLHPALCGLPICKSSKMDASSSDLGEHSIVDHLAFRGSISTDHSTKNLPEQTAGGGRKDSTSTSLFQPYGAAMSQHDERHSSSGHAPGGSHNEKNQEISAWSPCIKTAKSEDACVQSQSGDDLFDMLGIDYKKRLFNDTWNKTSIDGSDSSAKHAEENNYTFVKNQDTVFDLYSNNGGSSMTSVLSASSSDHLLDAVISYIHPPAKEILDETVSCRTTSTNSSSVLNTSLSRGQIGVSNQMQGGLFNIGKPLEKPGKLSSLFRSGSCGDKSGACPQSSSIYESQISSWAEQGQDTKQTSSVSTAYSKRPDEASKTNRKRSKPGESPRPRPKDRQMIQDRVKELREIVPNGAKCSIDALLERTIKHMLFLESVTKHADKLKQTGESKIVSKEGGVLLKDNFEGGATWAYEVGSQSMICPIIVEDLNQPRQMLVEMLCEERGLFLEIADIIRGLGLTILKGVMETRNDKIWARFAVEANKDVTRMEIFVSLVRLLEQNVKSGEGQANCVGNGATCVHQFH